MSRIDLHVHSKHSGLNRDLRFLRSRDCYSSPFDVYRVARARGMDLVTITDHDSIDGCLEFLDAHPDAPGFLVGEEVSCTWPGSGLVLHLGVYGLTEQIHRDLQPLRTNAHDVIAYLRTTRAVAIVNHPFHFYSGQVDLDAYVALITSADGIEARNGAMLPAHNGLAARIARASGRPLAQVGGSDSHALGRIGRTWTEASATTAADLVEAMRRGDTRPGGAHGSVTALAGDIYRVVARYWGALATGGYPELTPGRRLLGTAFSVATLPGQVTPLVVSALHKRREARVVAESAHALFGSGAPATSREAGRAGA